MGSLQPGSECRATSTTIRRVALKMEFCTPFDRRTSPSRKSRANRSAPSTGRCHTLKDQYLGQSVWESNGRSIQLLPTSSRPARDKFGAEGPPRVARLAMEGHVWSTRRAGVAAAAPTVRRRRQVASRRNGLASPCCNSLCHCGPSQVGRDRFTEKSGSGPVANMRRMRQNTSVG